MGGRTSLSALTSFFLQTQLDSRAFRYLSMGAEAPDGKAVVACSNFKYHLIHIERKGFN